jgi:hypothetical protein
MFELKQLRSEAIDRSLEKAERYRLLNEPEQAESICLDVLAISPNNQKALVTLLLALTDQFPHGSPECVRRAQDVLPQLDGEYERAYYAGIIAERRAYARLGSRTAGAEAVAYELFRQAMELYEKAETLSPFGNEDALLRWNTCARQIIHHRLEPARAEPQEPLLLE